MRRKILKNKLFLYFTEFFAGMSVMAVELGASRLLAPYFSSSQIVWTIIIGTIMIAMALGNIYGGRKADKDPNPDKLYRRIIIASVWIALIPVAGKYVIVGISGLLIFTISTNFLIIAALISCLVIFVFPLFLLGTVTPSLARYTVENVNDSGKVVGNLNAFNTVGSIIGTFVPTFISIPAVGTSITFLIFAGILLALAIIYFISPKEKSGDDFQPEAKPSHQPEEEEPAETERTGAGSTEPKPDVQSAQENKQEEQPASEKAGEVVDPQPEARADIHEEIKSTEENLQPPKKKELKTPVAGIIIACLVFVLSCIFGHNNSFAFWESNLTYEGESIYNYLQVSEDDEERILSTNVLFGVQSVMLKKPGLTGMYYDYAMASPFMAGVHEKESLDVLILGMGTGTFATQCTRYLDGLNIEGVEIDEKITDLAREYFELSEDIKVTTYDGRAYLNAVDKKYDLIMVDAYQDITIPFQMSTIEFFSLVRDHLTEDGVMVVNMNMRGSEEGNINQYLADTISAVFSEVYTVDVPYATNRELFASDNPDLIDCFKTNAELEKNAELKKLMQKIEKNIEAYDAGTYLLTDDKAPVELLGMKVIDELIVDEVSYYKNLVKEEGIGALINDLLGE